MTLNRATFNVTQNELDFMVLVKGELPQEFQGYQVVREGGLDNDMLAQHGFAGRTGALFRQAGRITGYMREFGPTSDMVVADGFNFVAATVAHLFDTPEAVSGWIHNIFLKDFEENVGNSVGEGQQLISVQRLQPSGYFDEAVAIKVVQGGPAGVLASTVIDFRVGRILGVAFVGAVGDHERLELANQLGQALEKRIVRIVLGAG